MRRFLLVVASLLFAYMAEAQMVSTSSLIVTKEKFPAVERGYESMIELSPTIEAVSEFLFIDINYIGGYRFNNTLFLGVGTGLNFYMPGKGDFQNINKLYVPLYAHAKVYVMKGRLSPFVALSVGARLSTKRFYEDEDGYEKKYSTTNFLINPRIGVNYRFTPDVSGYVSLGYEPFSYVEDDRVLRYTDHCVKITLGVTF